MDQTDKQLQYNEPWILQRADPYKSELKNEVNEEHKIRR